MVRIYFPNRIVVQGRFWSKETLGDVRQFVSEFLEDSTTPFYLYTSPPRIVYEDLTQSLQDAKLAPYANIRIGSSAPGPHLKREQTVISHDEVCVCACV
jgi:tether containing UBX domain for GLUT4